ncbi:MAG TPA: type I secretion system permease/ATPase, partial [Pararhizobium sp.]|nr:type I secretion system permease/ATPase [Pararhizobium sp.]
DGPDPLSESLALCRRAFFFVGAFSLVVNVLLLTTSVYLMQVFDRVIPSASMPTLIYMTMIAGLAILVLAILEAIRIRLLSRISAWLERRLAPTTLARTVDDALSHHGDRTAALIDLATLRNFIGGPSVMSLFDAPWVPIYLVVIYILHPMLGHVALAGGVLLFALAIANDLLTRGAIEKATLSVQKSVRIANAAVRNAEVVDALGLTGGVLRRWAFDSGEALKLQSRASDRAAVIQGLSRFVRLFVQIMIIAVGARLVVGHVLTSGAMMAASLIMARALAPVEQSIGTWKQAVHARQARRRLKAFFSRPPRRPRAMRLPPPNGHVRVEGVVFGFAMGKLPVLKSVSFEIMPGEAVAVIGPSAAGKSTLARLLVGVERPNVGTVRLGGADIFSRPRAEIGDYLGYLPQDVELFSGTVCENIARLGDIDTERVVEAARLANCHDMILRLDDGYETEIGDGGLQLSGGQRQRIALARALYGDPKFIVLDEPNASLDSEGETALGHAIAACKERGASVVVMGHRPSTLGAVDKILILVDGRVQAFGGRQELMERMAGRTAEPAVAKALTPAAIGQTAAEGPVPKQDAEAGA